MLKTADRDRARTLPARLEAVEASQLVGSPPEEVFDRLTRLAAEALGVPAAFLSIVGKEADFYKSFVGLGEPLASVRRLEGETFCHFTLVSDGVLAIEDATIHPVFSRIPTVKSLGVVAYVGVPIRSRDGYFLGAFCAVDVAPRRWSDADLDVMVALTRSAVEEIHRRGGFDDRPTETPASDGDRFYDALSPVVYALFLRILGDATSSAKLLTSFMAEIWLRKGWSEAAVQAAILCEARERALNARSTPAGSQPDRGAGSGHWPASLSDRERRILSLSYFDGLQVDRIAASIESTEPEVRLELAAAMRKLRRETQLQPRAV